MRRNVLKCLLAIWVLCAPLSAEASGNNVTVLHSFSQIGGILPAGGLIKDSAGNLYGVTQRGGANDTGTVFKLTAGGAETVLQF